MRQYLTVMMLTDYSDAVVFLTQSGPILASTVKTTILQHRCKILLYNSRKIVVFMPVR